MDGVVSPRIAVEVGRLGGLGVLNLEGLWTRYEDPEPLLEEIASITDPIEATRRMQQNYSAEYAKAVVESGVDYFVIRGTTVSAEHVSSSRQPLNLKQFIYELDVPVIVGGCATYQAALHLMRTGAAGVLVGFGGGSTHTTPSVLGVALPMASAVAGVPAGPPEYPH